MELPSSLDKGLVGALFVPPNLSNQDNTTLITSYTGTSDSNQPGLVSSILNITLSDGQGNAITQLDSPLTICLAYPNSTKKDQKVCLGYYDENRNKWKCEDECLTVPKSGMNRENLLCGQTDHLTSFALLLFGKDEEYPCKSDPDKTLAWISLGMVAGAIVVVALSVVFVEVYFRWRLYRLDKQLTKACTQLKI